MLCCECLSYKKYARLSILRAFSRKGDTMENPERENTEPAELIIAVGMLDGRAVEKPAPCYPVLVEKAHLGGRTVVEVLINTKGEVEHAGIVSGHPVVYNAVLEAARQAKFWPTLVQGQPVKVSGFLSYDLDES